eukprot:5826326-Pleurochrysis_carterae.AAC.4
MLTQALTVTARLSSTVLPIGADCLYDAVSLVHPANSSLHRFLAPFAQGVCAGPLGSQALASIRGSQVSLRACAVRARRAHASVDLVDAVASE